MRALLRPESFLVLAALSLGPLCPPAHAQRDSAFMEAFRKAMKINASDEMVRLVKTQQAEAVLAVIETCDQIGIQSNDQLEAEIDALSKAWKTAYDSRFVLKQYEYFSLLSGEYKKSRAELIDRYLKEYEKYAKAEKEKDKGKFPAVGLEMYGLGSALEDLGDYYMASMCYLYYAKSFDEPQLGEDADLRRACEGFGFVCEMRDKIELKDGIFTACKERFDFLEFEGYGDPSKGPEARKAARAAADASFAPHPLEAKFEPLVDIDAIERPRYTTDSIFQAWPLVYLEAEGTSGTIATMEQLSPTIVREGANVAKVDLDHDGKGDVDIPLTGNITPVQVTIGSGDEQREYAFLTCIGAQDDTVQGIRPFNLAPSKEQMQIFVAPAASIVGTIGETPVRIIDENMDGIYGGEPKGWGYPGLREGDYQWEVDSMVIGDSTHALPFSQLAKIGDAWYHLESNEAGTDVIAQKEDVETGTLKLDFKGLDADYLIVRGRGKLDHVFFDLAPGGKKGTEVPAGSYELFSGKVSKGKRSQMMKALVVPSKNTPGWTVTAGGDATVELGAPFGFDFNFTQDDTTVTVLGDSIVVTGKSNETYQRLWNCVPQPEVNLRKTGSKKGSKEKKLRPAGTQDEVNEVGLTWIWFPIAWPIEKKKEGEAVDVQLFEKKNRLFGKIESDWKES